VRPSKSATIPEIYMQVLDPRKIQKLMVIQGVSARTLAEAVGYASHSYITRILRGEIKTVTPERAARIARFFGVGIDDLFVPRLSTDAGPSVKRKAS
jgi:transcriptional regulator with XRE-family HTH domain